MKLRDIILTCKNKYLNVYIAEYENKNGETKLYEIISRKDNLTPYDLIKSREKSDAVGIIAYSKDRKKILLQKEYRLACGNWVYNFPGGLIDEGETCIVAAKRELKEETGLDIIEIIDTLAPSFTAVGISNEVIDTVICVADGTFQESICDDEEIEAGWYTKDEIRLLLKSGAPMAMRTQSYLYLWANS